MKSKNTFSPYLHSLGVLVTATLLAGCGSDKNENSAGNISETSSTPSQSLELPIKILTVNYPLEFFASRIAGELADVSYPGTANSDPAYWTPSTEDAQQYQQADLVLLNGAGYAQWLDKFSLPRKNQLNTGAAFREQWIQETESVTHSHGPDGEHTHTGFATTLWLDPMQAIQQAGAIRSTLSRMLPESSRTFDQNHRELIEELNHLDSELGNLLAEQINEPWLASHPVYQYFGRRYELNLRSVHWEPGQELGSSDWEELDQILEEHPAKWMLWEGEPAETVASGLKDRGITPVVFEIISTQSDGKDYLESMWENFNRLQTSINKNKKSP